MQTIRMIAKNLAKSADGDVPAGEQMAYASYITGMAYSNVGLGLVHGMAHPLAAASALPTALPTAFCWHRSWNTTRTSPARSIVTSPTLRCRRCLHRRSRDGSRRSRPGRAQAHRRPEEPDHHLRSRRNRSDLEALAHDASTTCAPRATRVRPPKKTSSPSTRA